MMTTARDLQYLAAVLAWSIVGFAVWVAGVSVTASTIVLIAGVFVWIGFAYVMRWTTAVDRRLAGWLSHDRVAASYRRPSQPGFIAQLRTVSTDPQTWRDFGWLALNSIVGFAAAIAVFTSVAVVVACVSAPIWYLASDRSYLESFALVAVGAALTPVVVLFARAAAAGHARLAARVLSGR